MSGEITVYGEGDEVGTITVRTTQPRGGIILPPGVSPGPSRPPDDGGPTTPSDPTITKPSITFPSASDNTDIDSDDTATSSAFAATGGRAHVASRWWIYYVGQTTDEDGPPQQVLLYDSGPDTVNLTSLPFTDIDFEHESQYKICVRHKAGTSLTWSEVSELQPFFTDDCVPDAYVNWDASDLSTMTIVAGRVEQWRDLGSAGIDMNADNSWAATDPEWVTDQFADGAIVFDGKEGFELDSYLTDVGGELSLFMVCYWIENPGFDGALMLTENDNTLVSGGFQVGVQQLVAVPGAGFGYCASVPVPPAVGAVQNMTTGKHIVEFILDSAGTSRVRIDGVEADTSTDNFSAFQVKWLCGQAGTMISRDYQLAEIIGYDEALSSDQATFVRETLAAKWDITLP